MNAPTKPTGKAERALFAAGLILGVLGFVTSFDAVSTAMKPHFGDLAWTVPRVLTWASFSADSATSCWPAAARHPRSCVTCPTA